MPITQRLVSWLALVALLVSTPATAYGRFECSLGMTQAGPACSLCHGRSDSPVGGPSIQAQCCKYVDAKATPAELATTLHLTRLTRSLTPIPVVPTTMTAGVESLPSPRLACAAFFDRAAPCSPSPLYLSNFLRL